MSARVGIGVIGTGLMGRRHAANAAGRVGEAGLVAVFDAAPDVARRVAADLGAVAAASVDELVARDDVKVVVVASPSRYHADHAIAALDAGKDVLLEKPMALTLADCDRVIAAAGRGRARLQLGFMRRYDAPYAEAQRRIRSGELGAPVLFKATSRDRDPADLPAAEGVANALLESAIHDFDLARWLIGDEVVRVATTAAAVCHGGTCAHAPNAVLTTLELARGALGAVETYRGARYAYDVRSEVVCDGGTVVVGEERLGRLAVLTPTDRDRSDDPGFLRRFADAYVAELADFVAGVRERRPAAITGVDGRAAVAIALAGVSSVASRGAATVSA